MPAAGSMTRRVCGIGSSSAGQAETMSLDPKWEPITRPVSVWLEIAAQLAYHGEGGLATAIQEAMDGRRLGDNATFALTVDEQQRVNAVLQECLRAHDFD